MDENGVITMTNADGTSYTADIGNLIKTYNFVDSDQIDFTATLQLDGSYSVTGTIKGGSITDAMIESGYLASVTAQASSASTSSQNATAKATLAESYAKGGTNTRTGEDTDNAKYYSDRASALVDVDIATTSKAGIVKPDGTTIIVDADGTIHSPGGHTHANKATLDSITEQDLTDWNAKASTVNITQSGTSISLNDAKNASLQRIKLYGKSTQNGTPTVKTPISIVDVVNPKITDCKKNLFNINYLLNVATRNCTIAIINNAVSVSATGIDCYVGVQLVQGAIATNDNIIVPVNPNTTYSITLPDKFKKNFYNLCDINKVTINNYVYVASNSFVITTNNNTRFINFRFGNGTGISKETYQLTIQMEYGTVATTYEPYTEQTATVNGTFRSVGDVKDIIDSVSGKITRKIGNIASYNGETITTDYISSTGALTTGAAINYVLPTPTEENIDTTTLTALRALTTYNPITNIRNDNSCDMDIAYQLGVATNDSIGFVKPDNITTTVDANGVITATAQTPGIATPLVAGIVKFDDETIGMDENHALYVIGGGQASGVAYSNTESGLSAENVQDAIDEVNNSLSNLSQFNTCDLLGRTGSTGNFTVSDMSQYTFIMICITGTSSGGWEYPAITMPYTYFKNRNSQSVSVLCSAYISVQITTSCWYASDTKVYVNEVGSGRGIAVYGIK